MAFHAPPIPFALAGFLSLVLAQVRVPNRIGKSRIRIPPRIEPASPGNIVADPPCMVVSRMSGHFFCESAIKALHQPERNIFRSPERG